MVPGDAPNVGMNIELLKRPKGGQLRPVTSLDVCPLRIQTSRIQGPHPTFRIGL